MQRKNIFLVFGFPFLDNMEYIKEFSNVLKKHYILKTDPIYYPLESNETKSCNVNVNVKMTNMNSNDKKFFIPSTNYKNIKYKLTKFYESDKNIIVKGNDNFYKDKNIYNLTNLNERTPRKIDINEEINKTLSINIKIINYDYSKIILNDDNIILFVIINEDKKNTLKKLVKKALSNNYLVHLFHVMLDEYRFFEFLNNNNNIYSTNESCVKNCTTESCAKIYTECIENSYDMFTYFSIFSNDIILYDISYNMDTLKFRTDDITHMDILLYNKNNLRCGNTLCVAMSPRYGKISEFGKNRFIYRLIKLISKSGDNKWKKNIQKILNIMLCDRMNDIHIKDFIIDSHGYLNNNNNYNNLLENKNMFKLLLENYFNYKSDKKTMLGFQNINMIMNSENTESYYFPNIFELIERCNYYFLDYYTNSINNYIYNDKKEYKIFWLSEMDKISGDDVSGFFMEKLNIYSDLYGYPIMNFIIKICQNPDKVDPNSWFLLPTFADLLKKSTDGIVEVFSSVANKELYEPKNPIVNRNIYEIYDLYKKSEIIYNNLKSKLVNKDNEYTSRIPQYIYGIKFADNYDGYIFDKEKGKLKKIDEMHKFISLAPNLTGKQLSEYGLQLYNLDNGVPISCERSLKYKDNESLIENIYKLVNIEINKKGKTIDNSIIDSIKNYIDNYINIKKFLLQPNNNDEHIIEQFEKDFTNKNLWRLEKLISYLTKPEHINMFIYRIPINDINFSIKTTFNKLRNLNESDMAKEFTILPGTQSEILGHTAINLNFKSHYLNYSLYNDTKDATFNVNTKANLYYLDVKNNTGYNMDQFLINIKRIIIIYHIIRKIFDQNNNIDNSRFVSLLFNKFENLNDDKTYNTIYKFKISKDTIKKDFGIIYDFLNDKNTDIIGYLDNLFFYNSSDNKLIIDDKIINSESPILNGDLENIEKNNKNWFIDKEKENSKDIVKNIFNQIDDTKLKEPTYLNKIKVLYKDEIDNEKKIDTNKEEKDIIKEIYQKYLDKIFSVQNL